MPLSSGGENGQRLEMLEGSSEEQMLCDVIEFVYSIKRIKKNSEKWRAKINKSIPLFTLILITFLIGP